MKKKRFSPSYDEDTQSSYDERADRCSKLRKGSPEYLAEGCKREKHLMIEGGRSHLRYAKYGAYPRDKKEGGPKKQGKSESRRTRRRLDDRLPPWDRRTQSPKTLRSDEERHGRAFDQLEQQIAAAIAQYQASRGAQGLGFAVPDTPWPLIAAGMPRKTAWILSNRAAGRVFTTGVQVSQLLPEKKSLQLRIERGLGGRLVFGGTGGAQVMVIGKEKSLGALGNLDIYIGGEFFPPASRSDAQLEERHNLWVEAVKAREGFYRAAESDPILMKVIFGEMESLIRAKAARGGGLTEEAMAWFPFSKEEIEIDISDGEHSKLVDESALLASVEYRSLRHVDLSDLPILLARLTRRKKHEGRRLKKARNNPMEDDALKNLILQQLALSPSRFVGVPGKPGRVYWWSKRKGTIVETTQDRAETWAAIARTGKMAARILSEDAKSAYREEGFPHHASLKENPMSHDDDWHDYQYFDGPYLDNHRAPPAARRNRKRRKKKTKSAKALAWQKEFGQISKLASILQKQRGCSYKVAWDEARGQLSGGRAAANPWYFGRGRGGGPKGSNLYLPDTTQVRPALVPARHPWNDDTEIYSSLVKGPYKARRNTSWNKEFGEISKRARSIRERGESWKSAWDRARMELTGRRNPRGSKSWGGSRMDWNRAPAKWGHRPYDPLHDEWQGQFSTGSARTSGTQPYARRNNTPREDEWLYLHETPTQRRKSKKRRGKSRRNPSAWAQEFGAISKLARKIRKPGESWKSAWDRARASGRY